MDTKFLGSVPRSSSNRNISFQRKVIYHAVVWQLPVYESFTGFSSILLLFKKFKKLKLKVKQSHYSPGVARRDPES